MKRAIPDTIALTAKAMTVGFATLTCIACGPASVPDNAKQADDGPQLTCQDCPEAAWAALRAQVERLPSVDDDTSPPLHIEMRMTRMDPHFIAAYLVLQQGDEPPHITAPMEVSVMDSTVGANSYNQLVKALFAANTAYFSPVPKK